MMVSKNPLSIPLIIFASSMAGMILAPCIGCAVFFSLVGIPTGEAELPSQVYLVSQAIVFLGFAVPLVILPIFSFSRLVATYPRARVATLVYTGVVILSLPLWLIVLNEIGAYLDTMFKISDVDAISTLNVLGSSGLLLVIHTVGALLIARYFRSAAVLPA